MRLSAPVLLWLIFIDNCAYSSDLIDVYKQAIRTHPTVAEAMGGREAALANSTVARAAYLPQVAASVGGTFNSEGSVQEFPVSEQAAKAGGRSVANRLSTTRTAGVYGINIQQSLFSRLRRTSLTYARTQSRQTECDYQAAVQRVMFEVGNAYFAVVAAEETLDAQRAAREDIRALWDQSRQRVDAGTLSAPDVLQAEAAYYVAEAAVANAQAALASAKLALRIAVGSDVRALKHLAEDQLLEAPYPTTGDEWLAIAIENNPGLCSARLAVELSSLLERSKRDARVPTVNLVASYSSMSGVGGGNTTLVDMETGAIRGQIPSPPVTQQDGWAIGIELAMPLYSGGAVGARIQQASAQRDMARARVAQALREIEREVQDSYQSVLFNMAQVTRRRLAFAASRGAVEATEQGYDIGSRTAAELLLVRQQLLQSKVNYLQSRISYVLSVLRLQYAAGLLSEGILHTINARLVDWPNDMSFGTQQH